MPKYALMMNFITREMSEYAGEKYTLVILRKNGGEYRPESHGIPWLL